MLVEELKGIFSMPLWGPAEHKYITDVNPLNAELNPICHLLALLGAHHIFHVSGLRVNSVQVLLLEQKISTHHMATVN